MSLKEAAWTSYGSFRYNSIRRFLKSSVGKQWDVVYSEICAAAPANSETGRQLRRAVDWYVDVHGPSALRHPNDYYVENGILYERPDEPSYKQRQRQKIQNAPITRIVYKNPRVWFELTDIVDGRPGSKYSTLRRLWFRFETVVVYDTVPNQIWNSEKKKYINDGTVHQISREIIHKRQCSRKEINQIQKIVNREVSIFRLTWYKKIDTLGIKKDEYLLQAEVR